VRSHHWALGGESHRRIGLGSRHRITHSFL
jgi:hypothetical protein